MNGQQPIPHDSKLMAWDELDEEQKNPVSYTHLTLPTKA